MKLAKWGVALAAAFLVNTGWVPAQAQDVGQLVYEDGPGVTAVKTKRTAQPVNGALTSQQSKAIAQGRGVRPGVYRLRSLLSGGCVTPRWGGAKELFLLPSCNAELVGYMSYEPAGYDLAILPHPAGGFTIRSAHPTVLTYRQNGLRAPMKGEYGNCLTVARNVILGAPRLELLPCDTATGDWMRAGADDQRFFLHKVGPDAYQIALALTGDGTDCWTLRGGSRDTGTEVIRWQCNPTADQHWQLIWAGPIAPDRETRLLDQAGWYPTASGHFNILGAEGLDLTGPVYNSFDTANDGGDYCRKRCAELTQCKAWTWTGPGYVTNSSDPPKCYWKSASGEPINRGPQSFAKLRSGVVRP